MLFALAFWRATLERALSTAAQAGILSIGQDIADGIKLDAFHFDWLQLLSYMAGGFVLAVLKAVAAAKVGQDGPGFGSAETLTPAVAATKPADAPADVYEAGPAADVPEGTPVAVEPLQEYDGPGE